MAADLAQQAPERVSRPLAGLSPDQQRRAWQEAVKAKMGMPSVTDVEEAIEIITARGRGVPLAEAIADEAGITDRAARDILAGAEMPEEDRDYLMEAGCTRAQVAKVARIADPVARRELTSSLICIVGQAVGRAQKDDTFARVWAKAFPPAPDHPEGATVIDVNGGPRGKAPSEDDMEDEEWLSRIPIREHVAQPRVLDQEALRWRRMRSAIKTLRDVARSHGIGEKKTEVRGWFTYLLSRLIHANHPWNWTYCNKCDGRGLVQHEGPSLARGGQCPACQGAGFRG